ncbi:selenocysteine-specific translation elongation factor [Alkalihalophilus pseudofirmus]|uniref:selenocysteine-specific translation elongation factor n=1 Tax=Alkalihalophilus pseudofirmus TaxID=79885 RepID=UPI00259B5070|nr:selenocysteine-specific translation elongation factor [Alkalihalophilus pseudofirmus]WEG15507.1 selenocysteine-specific translation elongation factor [Alkalihalophilus pseudofirmus]
MIIQRTYGEKEVACVKKHFTIGMAGHIDHGKTSLTKALTNVYTDRLKEEQERKISIELGYAPLTLNEDMEVSIIDVPGHERFIRQMIAGVAGIDMVMLVIAADEGVMPQTREHLDILTLLGIKRGVVVVTKITKVDSEMLELARMDIEDSIRGTFLDSQPVFLVDSIEEVGLEELKAGLIEQLSVLDVRNASGAFRLPIDQVFTVHGQGTVVRGTVYEGMIQEGDMVEVLPQGKLVRARQLQVHHQPREEGHAGQRVAINIGGIEKASLKRGDVIAAPGRYESTQTIDIALKTVNELNHLIKQRQAIKLHIGTSEVYGKIVFFDRNELQAERDEVLCQLRLDEPVVTRRGDRFILRRPTPMETIGGGEVIDGHGQTYKFGQATVQMLAKKREGTPEELIINLLSERKALSIDEIISHTGLQAEIVEAAIKEKEFIPLSNSIVTSKEVSALAVRTVIQDLTTYHNDHPMRKGMAKAELIQANKSAFPNVLFESVIENEIENGSVRRIGPSIALVSHHPHPPKKWEKRVEHVLGALRKEGFKVSPLIDHLEAQQLPENLRPELIHYFEQEELIYRLDEKLVVHYEPFKMMVKELWERSSESFTLQEAKDHTELSRKYLVPFLEKLDSLKLTKRDDQKRVWITEHIEQWVRQS